MAIKDIKVEDLAGALGFTIEDAEKVTLEDMKGHIGSKFILRENAVKDEDLKKTIVGSVLGKLTSKAAQAFGLKSSEVEGKQMEEIFTMAKTGYETKITELTEAAGKGNDKKVEDLTKQIGALTEKYTALETGKATLEKQLNEAVTGAAGKLKEFKLNDIVGKAKSGIVFTDEFTKNPLVKAGFESHMATNYQFDLDETDKPIVKDKAGKIVMSPVKPADFATPEEVFKFEADKLGVLKKNNAKPEVKVITTAAGTGGETKSKISPAAVANAERLAAQKNGA